MQPREELTSPPRPYLLQYRFVWSWHPVRSVTALDGDSVEAQKVGHGAIHVHAWPSQPVAQTSPSFAFLYFFLIARNCIVR